MKTFYNKYFFSCEACRENEFRCNDGTCIRSEFKCNRRADCQDGSDERDCASRNERCRAGEFQCLTGECIAESRKCDRHVDCRDGSDENDCRKLKIVNLFLNYQNLVLSMFAKFVVIG